jgi:hypothetical protein
LQALQERPTGHESAADYDRTGPGEADKRRKREIAKEVIDLEAKSRAGCPLARAEGDNHEQDDEGGAANFCHKFDCHGSYRSSRKMERAPTASVPAVAVCPRCVEVGVAVSMAAWIGFMGIV